MANTTTKTGLKTRAELDARSYPAGIKTTYSELAALNLQPANFHRDWYYTLFPK